MEPADVLHKERLRPDLIHKPKEFKNHFAAAIMQATPLPENAESLARRATGDQVYSPNIEARCLA
jgi:hypothetical protein